MAEEPTKYCAYGKHNVPISNFALSRTSADGKQGYCKDCTKVYQKEYYDKTREKRKKYHQSKRRKARRKEVMAAWHERNPEVNRVYRARQRAAIIATERGLDEGALGEYTTEEWIELCEYYNYTCLACFKARPVVEIVADHVVPLEKGGHNTIDNIQPLCRGCNASKQDRVIDYRPRWEKLMSEGKVSSSTRIITLIMPYKGVIAGANAHRWKDEYGNSLRLSHEVAGRDANAKLKVVRVTIEVAPETDAEELAEEDLVAASDIPSEDPAGGLKADQQDGEGGLKADQPEADQQEGEGGD